MSVFVDTSAFLAMLDRAQRRHDDVANAWRGVVAAERPLVTSNYVVVESFALLQRRVGMDAVRVLVARFLPLVETVFATDQVHAAATSAFLTADRRRLSFVDCVSFELMRQRGISEVLSLDADFQREGFRLLPPSSD
ncbi:MAG: type II toxin-antitoxin system VapC family toxin [Acidobacteria bacterium]|nr:type II toxin-antitoxin system VapC family toxin [Acidobacteriota bacterium]MYH22991.1 type II toxin-antitoxin system VapC family toxin [Acidobacteriota bacterium]MYK78548.1 type II toxin-antitoxin system VapC family toxin [Acidobacteriota bacterium]